LFRLWQVRNFWPRSSSYFLPERFLELIKRSWHYFSYTLTQLGYEKVAIISFGLVATHEDVGLLSAALILASVFPSFTYAASDALLPVMTRLFEAGRTADLLELRARLMNLLLILCVPVGLVLAVFAPEICGLLGAKYIASAPILRITATRSLFSVLDNFLGQSGLTALARVRERRNAQALGLVLCAGLTIVAGHFWGTLGAALATLVADAIILASYFFIYARIKMPIHCPAAWSSAIAGLVMAGTALATPQLFWPVRALVATATYFLVLAIIARGRLLETAHTFKQSFIGS
jgi:O-antigen/teichoic acid export membrane protein